MRTNLLNYYKVTACVHLKSYNKKVNMCLLLMEYSIFTSHSPLSIFFRRFVLGEEWANNKNLDIILLTYSKGVQNLCFVAVDARIQKFVYITSKQKYTINLSSLISFSYAVKKGEKLTQSTIPLFIVNRMAQFQLRVTFHL